MADLHVGNIACCLCGVPTSASTAYEGMCATCTGSQVDITSGKFVFSCTEAYRVENGVVGAPVKGATLIGDGATALKNIRAIGNDMALDPGMGNCGKAGQWVPVGVGQPTLLIGGLTVGGSAA